MPKAIILFSFKKGDTSPLIKNLTRLTFNTKEGRGRTILSKEFSLNEVELNLSEVNKVKESIASNAKVMISSPQRIWRKAFGDAGLGREEASSLAGLAMAEAPTASVAAPMEDAEMEDIPSTMKSELSQEESQSQGIVDDDFDVDALVSSLANAKLGGRRRKTLRHKRMRRSSRKSHMRR